MRRKAAGARQRPRLRKIPSRIELPGWSIRIWMVSRSTMRRYYGTPRDEQPAKANWDVDHLIIRLRRDRTFEQRVDDLGHELIHVTVDWWNWALKKDRTAVRP